MTEEKTKGEVLFEATRRPSQRGEWVMLGDSERGHFEAAARKYEEATHVADLKKQLEKARVDIEQLQKLVEPWHVCAQQLADEVDLLVRRGVIDSRSPAADALLDVRNPPTSPRSDRMLALENENERLRKQLAALTKDESTEPVVASSDVQTVVAFAATLPRCGECAAEFSCFNGSVPCRKKPVDPEVMVIDVARPTMHIDDFYRAQRRAEAGLPPDVSVPDADAPSALTNALAWLDRFIANPNKDDWDPALIQTIRNAARRALPSQLREIAQLRAALERAYRTFDEVICSPSVRLTDHPMGNSIMLADLRRYMEVQKRSALAATAYAASVTHPFEQERAARERDFLVSALAELFNWKDTSFLHAVLHVKNAVQNLRSDLSVAQREVEALKAQLPKSLSHG